jgi:hypothetical protein
VNRPTLHALSLTAVALYGVGAAHVASAEPPAGQQKSAEPDKHRERVERARAALARYHDVRIAQEFSNWAFAAFDGSNAYLCRIGNDGSSLFLRFGPRRWEAARQVTHRGTQRVWDLRVAEFDAEGRPLRVTRTERLANDQVIMRTETFDWDPGGGTLLSRRWYHATTPKIEVYRHDPERPELAYITTTDLRADAVDTTAKRWVELGARRVTLFHERDGVTSKALYSWDAEGGFTLGDPARSRFEPVVRYDARGALIDRTVAPTSSQSGNWKTTHDEAGRLIAVDQGRARPLPIRYGCDFPRVNLER